MLWLSIAIVGLLTLINYKIAGKALLFPGFVFSGMWTLDFLIIFLAGDLFYTIHSGTYFFFICGALAFSIGSWIGLLLPEPEPPAKPVFKDTSNRILNGLIVVVVIGVPFFVRWVYHLVATQGTTASFLLLARMGVIEAGETGHDLAFTVFGTLVDLAGIVALVAFYERERHRMRALVALTIAMGMGVLIGQKIGPLSIIIALMWLDWLKRRRLHWKAVLLMLLVFVSVTVGIEFYVHIAGDPQQGKAGPVLVPVLESIAGYASGGMVGFDRLLNEPNLVPPTNPLYDSYTRIVRRLGGYIEVPPQSRNFVTVGPHLFQNNVFTMYGQYLFLGYAGAIVLTGLIGFIVTLVYKRALQGGMIAIMVYALLLRGVMFGAFDEYFLSFYPLFKLCVVVWIVYGFPVRWAQFRSFVSSAVQTGLVKGQ
jgi:oligosaccharide repeat unit polymerase